MSNPNPNFDPENVKEDDVIDDELEAENEIVHNVNAGTNYPPAGNLKVFNEEYGL